MPLLHCPACQETVFTILLQYAPSDIAITIYLAPTPSHHLQSGRLYLALMRLTSFLHAPPTFQRAPLTAIQVNIPSSKTVYGREGPLVAPPRPTISAANEEMQHPAAALLAAAKRKETDRAAPRSASFFLRVYICM